MCIFILEIYAVFSCSFTLFGLGKYNVGQEGRALLSLGSAIIHCSVALHSLGFLNFNFASRNYCSGKFYMVKTSNLSLLTNNKVMIPSN